MLVSSSQGVPVFQPLSEADRAGWHPSAQQPWQFVVLCEREWQLFHCGILLGTALRIRGSESWQAIAQSGDACIAPLASPLDCARRLLERLESD